jgi:diacylglycerol kinase family enzyme
MGRIALIVNPYASAVTYSRVESVARVLGEYGDVDVRQTTAPGHAVELVQQACSGAEAIVVYSGDGGFNEALNGLTEDVPIGFVPGGGTSVLSRALGLPRNPLAAARAIGIALGKGQTRRITVGRVNGRRFGFSAGVGFDAELVRKVDELGRSDDGRRPHDLAFALAAARLIGARRARFEPSLEVKGVGEAAFALVANCNPYTYFGPLPLRFAPKARFELGLDLVAPREVKPRAVPRFLAYGLFGRGPVRAQDVYYVHDADRLEIRCSEPMPLQVDGEDLGDVEEVLVEAERGAVAVLAPDPAD